MIKLDVTNPEDIKTICADKCGAKCCKRLGSTFKVPVSVSDFQRLEKQELDHYIDWDGMFPKLKTDKNDQCVFLDNDNNCSIYKIRPKSCKKYPFRHLKENIEGFCLLYHNSPEKYRKEQREIAEENISSTMEMLFDMDENSSITNEYLRRFEL